MTHRRLPALLLALMLGCALAAADHPRLLFSAGDIPALRAKITTEPILGMYNHLVANWDAGDWGSGSSTPPSHYDQSVNMANAGFLYVLTGDDIWAQRARALVESRIYHSDWNNASVKGLSLYMHGKGVALAYDFCHGAPSWADFSAIVSQKLLAQGNLIYSHGGTEQNGTSASNWQGARYAAGGLCLLATDEPVAPASLTGCFTRVNNYNTSNMGTGATNRGWNIEGIGYTMYPWGNFVGPYGIAAKRVAGQDIRLATPSAVDHTLWTVYSTGCLFQGAAPGQFDVQKPDWGDDNPGHTTEGTSGLAFYYCPPAMVPGLVHWYERTVGASGQATYDNARGGTIYSILFHPGTTVAPQDPMTIPEWVAAFVDTEGNGYQTFRDQYQDTDDLVAQVYVKRRGNAGHNGPDALGFRIYGMDTPWAVGGGRYGPKINGQDAYLRSQNSLYPVDPEAYLTLNGNSGTLIGTPTSTANGGSVVASMAVTNVNVRNHTRRFLADYTAASGAAGTYIVADTSDDGRWWQFCTLACNTISTSGNTFTITSPSGATLLGTVVHPATTTLTTGTRIRGSGSGHHGIGFGSNNYVHAQSADGDFLVVMTVVPPAGTHPPVTSLVGTAATSGRVLEVGGLQIAINGDRIAPAPTGVNATPTVDLPAAAAIEQVTGRTVALTVAGSDDGGEPGLSYTWSAVGASPAAVAFSPNGTNAAKATVATFAQEGVYELEARIADDQGLATTSTVTVTVMRAQTRIAVAPATGSMARSATRAFTAQLVDQFGVVLDPQPAFTWTASGGGTIASSGVFTSNTSLGGPYIITAATAGFANATATVSVTNQAPTVVNAATCANAQPLVTRTASLTALGADDLGEPALKYTWTTIGTPPAPVGFSPNNANSAKSTTATFAAAGTYTLRVEIKDASNAVVTSTVVVNAVRAQTRVAVTPASASVFRGTSLGLAAVVVDQFNVAMAPQPAAFAWAAAGGGTVDASGVFTAGSALGGPFAVTASGDGFTSSASISVINRVPTVAAPATCVTAQPITGKTAALSVLGADDLAESGLTYSWGTTGTPPAAVTFSPSGSNAAKSTTATFTKSGTYTLRATIKDASNATVVSDVTVSVVRTQTRIAVTPATANLARGASLALTAAVVDQFNVALPPQPTAFAWSAAAGGTVDAASGIFTAGGTLGGPFAVTASGDGFTGSANITVINGAPTVASVATWITAQPIVGTTAGLSVLGADDLAESGLIYSWATAGTPPAAVTFSPNGSNAAKNTTATFTKVGTYALRATIKDASNATVTSDVTVTVQPTLASIVVSPTGSSVGVDATQAYTASGRDQFAATLVAQPPAFTWGLSAGGAIDGAGLMTAASVAGGPYTVSASVAGVSGTAQVTVVAGALPTGWADRDLGIAGPAGRASFASASGLWTVAGAGSDIGGASDQFHFAYQSLTGNGEIVARVATQQNTNAAAKAGVMIRNGLAANVAFAYLAITPTSGAQFIRRATAGANASGTTLNGRTAPQWVKVVRNGTTLSAWVSADGLAWTQVGANQTITMGTTVLVGLAVTAKSAAVLGTATFNNVAVAPSAGG